MNIIEASHKEIIKKYKSRSRERERGNEMKRKFSYIQ